MEFEAVKSIPEIEKHGDLACEKKKLTAYLDGFMNMNVKYARVKFNANDYINVKTAFESIRRSVKRHFYHIKTYVRSGSIYLERTDISNVPKYKRSRKKVNN